MVDQKDNLELLSKSSWLDRNLLLSLSLFLTTYIVFGWLIASRAILWADFLHQQNIPLQVALEEDFLLVLIKSLAFIIIIIITLLLSIPVALTTFLFEESVNSDLRAFFSILIWSLVLVFAFCYFHYFADFLIIISANILFKLDLQKLKYRNWQVILLSLFLATLAFTGGMIGFDLFHSVIIKNI